jgi:hypothetical protein
MPLILVTSALVLLALPFLIGEYGLFSIALYLWLGFRWISHDKNIDRSDRPSYTAHSGARFLMVLVWPARFVAALVEYFHFRNCRFKVILGGATDSGDIRWKTFQSHGDALSFAKEQARLRGESNPVLIYDQIKHKMYSVGTDGTVRDSIGRGS